MCVCLVFCLVSVCRAHVSAFLACLFELVLVVVMLFLYVFILLCLCVSCAFFCVYVCRAHVYVLCVFASPLAYVCRAHAYVWECVVRECVLFIVVFSP